MSVADKNIAAYMLSNVVTIRARFTEDTSAKTYTYFAIQPANEAEKIRRGDNVIVPVNRATQSTQAHLRDFDLTNANGITAIFPANTDTTLTLKVARVVSVTEGADVSPNYQSRVSWVVGVVRMSGWIDLGERIKAIESEIQTAYQQHTARSMRDTLLGIMPDERRTRLLALCDGTGPEMKNV